MKINSPLIWVAGVMLALFLAATAFRPLLPIDETRYMTIAWEMRLHEGWLSPLTLNFEPYHHKPPMLFWLINLFWSVFGVSRWAGLLPIALMSFLVVVLTIRLGKKLLPEESYDPHRLAFLMCGSVAFLIYSTLVMFDLTLTVFVLCALLCLITYAEKRKLRYMAMLGLFLGLAVLTKGPVAYLYVIFPMLLGPLWVKSFEKGVAWYGDCVAAIALSVLPVCVWLVPVLTQSDNHFAFWLLWEQTAGRVTGSFHDAHVRPFYFYLPIALFLPMPWILFPGFWQSLKTQTKNDFAFRFIACWIVPVFLSFCIISGKQPHYLLPLLTGVIIFVSAHLKAMPLGRIRNIVVALVAVVIIGQAIASQTAFKNYDLQPMANYVSAEKERPWAWVRNYHGEIGFLAKMEHPIEERTLDDIAEWFDKNPEGMALIRYKREEDVKKFKKISSYSYRGKYLGIFKK